MILRISKTDLEQIILWGASYKDMCEEVAVPFEKDEDDLLDWLKQKRDADKPAKGKED